MNCFWIIEIQLFTDKHLGLWKLFLQTSMIFSSLKYYWIINFNGDLEKLEYITSAMNYLDEDFDPNPFI